MFRSFEAIRTEDGQPSKLLWPELKQIWLGCWPAHVPNTLSRSTNTPRGLENASSEPENGRSAWISGGFPMDFG